MVMTSISSSKKKNINLNGWQSTAYFSAGLFSLWLLLSLSCSFYSYTLLLSVPANIELAWWAALVTFTISLCNLKERSSDFCSHLLYWGLHLKSTSCIVQLRDWRWIPHLWMYPGGGVRQTWMYKVPVKNTAPWTKSKQQTSRHLSKFQGKKPSMSINFWHVLS